MKTLLLSLVVVAFVYLDSSYSIICYMHPRPKLLSTVQNCPHAKACYTNKSGLLGLNIISKGCATNCTFPAAGEKIELCTEDYCNNL
uniref:Three finger toxins n=1 Tax=Phalotris mertensi TaxID=1260334 RepID=A0A182C5Y1_9SAUR